MKKITLFIATIILCQLAFSQVLIKRDSIYPQEEPKAIEAPKKEPKPRVQTLFQDQNSFGGYFGLYMGYTQIDGESAFSSGARFMFVANHYLGIGFGGKGFMTTPKSEYNDFWGYTNTYISNVGGYGGLCIEPIIYGLKPIHASIPILFGAGGIVNEIWADDYDMNHTVSSAFFVIEPGIELELNVATWFRLGLGASYVFTSKLEGLNDQPTNLLNGLNYGVTFKFGWF